MGQATGYIKSKCAPFQASLFICALILSFMILGCGGGDKASTTNPPSSMPPSTGAGTEFADLNPANAGYAATAAGRAAAARPRSGSVTQSSNTDNGITVDHVTVTAQYGAARNSYSVRNGSAWSISTSDGNPVSIPGLSAPLKGSELKKRIPGGTLYVDVYSDIEAPATRQVPTSGGTPVRLEDIPLGSRVGGMTQAEWNARMGDGTLNGVAGTFSCDRAGGGRCPSFGGTAFDPSGTDWIFTPHGSTRTETTPDADYLASGIWLFVPDGATIFRYRGADDVVFGAFADGSDPFRQSNLMALQGTARYDGHAAGIYSHKVNSGAEPTTIGYLEADVSLTANFGGRSDLGTIDGFVNNFTVDGEPESGELILGAADIGPANSGFFRGSVTDDGASDSREYTGQWGGQFFGNGESDGKPGSVAGTFGARSTDFSDVAGGAEVSIVGAFGAYKQGDKASTTNPPSSMPPSTGAGTEFADLNPANAGYAATAAGRAAAARPRTGSVTQSSNMNNGVTVDRVTVTAQYGATENSYSIRNGSSWSIGTSDGNPVSIPGVTAPFKGSELTKRVSGGALYVAVYSDIESPGTGATGQPETVEAGDLVEYTGNTFVLGRGQSTPGELNGAPGTFTCAQAGCSVSFRGGLPNQGSPLPVNSASGITFVPSAGTGTVTDADYLAGGVWLFVPDNATSADDVVFGAFADGSDPFRQNNLMALQGAAEYRGAAAGIYSGKSPAGTELGYWGGAVSLTADFGGQGGLGTISGSLTDIVVDDERYSGSLSLGTAAIGSSNSGFFEGLVSGTVEGSAYAGRWGGQFFGNGEEDGKPGSVAGTLGGRSTDDTVNFIGAFGAYKQ